MWSSFILMFIRVYLKDINKKSKDQVNVTECHVVYDHVGGSGHLFLI